MHEEDNLLDSVPVSEILKKLGNKDQNESSSVLEIIENFHENSILLAMIFFRAAIFNAASISARANNDYLNSANNFFYTNDYW